VLVAALLACAFAATASAGRAPVYTVSVTGSLSTSAFVPPHVEDGCWVDGVSGTRTLSFRTRQPVRTTSLSGRLPVSAALSAGGTHVRSRQCPDGAVSALAIDWGAPHAVPLAPLRLQSADRRLWLDGADDDISGVCFGSATPLNPLHLADAYAQLPARLGTRLTLHGEEDADAQGEGCLMHRSVRWTITIRRVS
jgi:hypothetical protein